MPRFSAKLLFQFRVITDSQPGKRRWCEQRIITFRRRSARLALAFAKTYGSRAEFKYKNSDNNQVRFEFIGVMEMKRMDLAADDCEVWYDIRQRLEPDKRRDRFIPPETSLEALQDETRPRKRRRQ